MGLVTDDFCPYNADTRQQKLEHARRLITDRPHLWLGPFPISERDLLLTRSPNVSFLEYDRSCYAAKLCHYYNFQKYEDDAPLQTTSWDFRNDFTCKQMVAEAGGEVVGFPGITRNPNYNWYHAKIDVKFSIPTASVMSSEYNVPWGILTTLATNARIFRGPVQETCRHGWDAMILYDCVASTEGPLRDCERIASRKWDILLMKMCNDYQFPFIVVAIRDSGPVHEAQNHVDGRN
ncbi:hypothetical protein GGS26DRAFT_587795 [Hypomontagnella submonticulosa]|nr:hypothetical protein GGS26DRAFT_587795 [Hypomontagnella submonticulosa]